MISDRLYAIANQINDVDVVCDIGTDHGLLSIFLIKHKKAKKIYAVDINKGPLKQASENTKKYEITSKKIILILGSGLKWKNNNLKINICVISGLGGKTIADILLDDDNTIEKYILCSNNNEIVIRKWIKMKKYFIEKEILIKDNNIIYPIIIVNKHTGFKIKNKKDLIFGPFLRRNLSMEYFDYWKLEYIKINSYIFNINKKDKRFKQLKQKIKLIKKEINKGLKCE